MRHPIARRLVALVAAGWVAAAAAPAQIGGLRGRVIDEAGKPVADAELVFDYEGEQKLQLTSKTNARGEWVRAGLMAVGTWTITARKGSLAGRATGVNAPMSSIDTVPDIVLRETRSAPASAPPAAAGGAPSALSAIVAEGNAAIGAGNYDLAIARFTEAAEREPKCAACFLGIGDAAVKKNDPAAAERAYLKVVEIDNASPLAADAYGALAVLYNQQKRLAEAAEMSRRETALRAAAGTGDAKAFFNAGAIHWNQGRITEAREQFARAVALDPTLADAHYYLGMCLVSEGRMAEARGALETYLKLAPAGANAPTAKAVLDSMK